MGKYVSESLKKRQQEVLDFWNERAKLAELAGSNDFVAKKLEIAALGKHVQSGQKILEVGCGNGFTAIEFARLHDVDILGIDFSEEMIKSAQSLAEKTPTKGRVRFEVADVRELVAAESGYDLIYTERVLINLPDWPAQAKAIKDIVQHLNPGGRYLMCENSQDGLDRINELRVACGLSEIMPPWHNCYFRDAEVSSIDLENVRLVDVECYSATYYFISRVVNAWLAAQEAEEPRYEAKVNQLALLLPSVGDYGQGKLWTWERD